MDPQHSIWIIKWQAKHINGWQTGYVWPRAREEFKLNSFPYSVNPRTGNTSVAWGRAFHQHNVWHRLRQMLCREILLTSTTFWGETQTCCYVQFKAYFAIKKKSPFEKYYSAIQSSWGSQKQSEDSFQEAIAAFCISLIHDLCLLIWLFKEMHFNVYYSHTLPMLEH